MIPDLGQTSNHYFINTALFQLINYISLHFTCYSYIQIYVLFVLLIFINALRYLHFSTVFYLENKINACQLAFWHWEAWIVLL